MKDFNDFMNYISQNTQAVLFDIKNNLKDVSESQRTITSEEWQFIEEYILQSNLAILRQYHHG